MTAVVFPQGNFTCQQDAPYKAADFQIQTDLCQPTIQVALATLQIGKSPRNEGQTMSNA